MAALISTPTPQIANAHPRTVYFAGACVEVAVANRPQSGSLWEVISHTTLLGDPIPQSEAIIMAEDVAPTLSNQWLLKGTVSHLRYTTSAELPRLRAASAGLARPEARCGALIPIRKNEAWWALAQDERRRIYEEESHHTTIGLDYLPAIARRLHHSRDLLEPFDFLTWFEFAPEDEPAFDLLLSKLRAQKEWHFVDREIDIRVRRID